MDNLSDALTYDGFGELAAYTASFGGNPFFTTQNTRDKLGRITQKVETVQGTTNTFNYTYDRAGRLTQVDENGAVAATYTYDANGNRLSKTALRATINGTYDNQDRLTQYGSTAYTYTADGEIKTKNDGSGTTSYQYDALGNLKQVTLPNGTVIDYLVDGENRRIGKVVNGTLVRGFLYQDGLRPIAELDGNGNVVARFIYATGSSSPSYMIKNGETYRIITDQLGSPRFVIDAATSAIAQQMNYDEFGNVTLDTNPGFQPFGFAGGLYDADTGLVHFGARDYDPYTGRWTAKDPILFRGGDTNLYGYCLSDPVNFMDPSGLVLWGQLAYGAAALIGGTVTAGAGALASETGIGAVLGVPAVLGGTATASWGLTKMLAALMNNNMNVPAPTPAATCTLALGGSVARANQVDAIVNALTLGLNTAQALTNVPSAADLLGNAVDLTNQAIQSTNESENGK